MIEKEPPQGLPASVELELGTGTIIQAELPMGLANDPGKCVRCRRGQCDNHEMIRAAIRETKIAALVQIDLDMLVQC
jgi:hypothetical protein